MSIVKLKKKNVYSESLQSISFFKNPSFVLLIKCAVSTRDPLSTNLNYKDVVLAKYGFVGLVD